MSHDFVHCFEGPAGNILGGNICCIFLTALREAEQACLIICEHQDQARKTSCSSILILLKSMQMRLLLTHAGLSKIWNTYLFQFIAYGRAITRVQIKMFKVFRSSLGPTKTANCELFNKLEIWTLTNSWQKITFEPWIPQNKSLECNFVPPRNHTPK